MQNWKTTLCGIIAAVSLSSFAGLGLAEPWPRVLMLVCSAALAALGYHAVDCSTCPGLAARKAAGLCVVFLLGLAVWTGCRIGSLDVGVSSPAFGAVSVSLDGGVIGQPASRSRASSANVGTNVSLLATNAGPSVAR